MAVPTRVKGFVREEPGYTELPVTFLESGDIKKFDTDVVVQACPRTSKVGARGSEHPGHPAPHKELQKNLYGGGWS